MKTINLTEAETIYLWQILTQLLSDSCDGTYITPGGTKHWKREAFFSPKGEAVLSKVYAQLLDTDVIEPVAEAKPKKRTTQITDAFRDKMHHRFDRVFGFEETDERIQEAIGHKSHQNYNDKQAHVTGWLRRDAERVKPQPSSSSTARLSNEQMAQAVREGRMTPNGKPIEHPETSDSPGKYKAGRPGEVESQS